ncbi:unnamed protein product [Prorocentrum cordatum]|uniref:Uncharacterized protein n=1 Tax=Prorocentrum cordatum TaxID=2364126 RepID=A0ABN9UIB2_9DINO|nr:unnamed protein product [Polarella glacialis]
MAKESGHDFDVDALSAGTWVSQETLRKFMAATNDRKQYRCSTHEVSLPVSFLTACQMLNLHEVFSAHDPVQIRVRGCIAQCRGLATDDRSSVQYWRSVLRAVIIIHATRRYEYAPSVVLGVLNRSNVLDTFDGGDYCQDFEEMVAFVQRSAAGASSGRVDAPVLDYCWDRVKNWRGFGGAGNEPGGNVDGFVAKNVAFQGVRNILHHCGFEHGAPKAFVLGPNPCKLACVHWQTPSPSREQQVAMYSAVLEGVDDCVVAYGAVWRRLHSVDAVVLQDNLCKAVEVLQTVTTGRFFGKARKSSLARFGVAVAPERALSSPECSGDEEPG